MSGDWCLVPLEDTKGNIAYVNVYAVQAIQPGNEGGYCFVNLVGSELGLHLSPKEAAGRLSKGLLHAQDAARSETVGRRPTRDIAESIVSKWGLLGADHDKAVDQVASALLEERNSACDGSN